MPLGYCAVRGMESVQATRLDVHRISLVACAALVAAPGSGGQVYLDTFQRDILDSLTFRPALA